VGITRGLIRVGIALPVLRGIATRLWGGHCEAGGHQNVKENSQSDDCLHDSLVGSRPAVQRIVPGPGDGMFDAGEVIVEDFLGSRTGDDRGFAIGRRHGNLCGHKGAGQIGSVFGARHRSVSYCVQVSIFLQHSAQYASARGTPIVDENKPGAEQKFSGACERGVCVHGEYHRFAVLIEAGHMTVVTD